MAKRNRGINIFQQVPQASPNRTQFPIRHKCDFDGDFGVGYPVFCQEVIPGDTWHISADHFSRLAPMVAPVYHDFDVRFHWFFVPMRLLWDDFEDWMTGGKTGTWREDNPDAFPLFDLAEVFSDTDEIVGTVFDFLGINTCNDGAANRGQIAADSTLPIMPLRGYWMIYNYFFRDQNVVDEVDIITASGLGSVDDLLANSNEKYFFNVSWDKDYFTSSTLSPQRGPQVYIPIGGTAPVVASSQNVPLSLTGNTLYSMMTVNGNLPQNQVDTLNVRAVTNGVTGTTPARLETDDGNGVLIAPANFVVQSQDIANSITTDLSSAEGPAVDDVREAFALQRFFERMQIVGSRFAEFLRGIWGTNAGDARLQMPEYLGTWRNPFMINNVSNTTGTDKNPQGGYAGNGMASQYNKAIEKYFPEYGYIYCIYSAMPRNGYQQGLSPIFCRRDWLDFANPFFEHIGEQPIAIKELYYDPGKTSAENEETFGYQSQYASYKFINSHSHGEFKKTLNFWHANRIFNSRPTLSREFIEYDASEATDRDFVLPNESKFYTTIEFDGYVERNLSAFSTPRLI